MIDSLYDGRIKTDRCAYLRCQVFLGGKKNRQDKYF